MTRSTLIGLGILGGILGGFRIWIHLNTGTTLTLEGCQGGLFTMELGANTAHCWGCYVAASGVLMSLTAYAWPYFSCLNKPNLS